MADAPKHTPGPWTIIPARPYEGDDVALQGSFEAFAGIEGHDGSPVCVFGDSAGSATMFENEADYHLIAAAPALLHALKNIVAAQWWGDTPPNFPGQFPDGCHTSNPLEHLARAAIAKAEGR